MNPETVILREMIRADLELAFEHLNNDLPELAEHELRKALEKVAQVRSAQAAASFAGPVIETEMLLTLTTDDHQNHRTGTAPEIDH